jgi:hemerythrin-like metal-binding protein
MSLLTWNDTYSVGVEALDDQHNGLFETLNELHDAMAKGQAKNITGPLLQSLVDYTHDHFAAEEALMATTKYPRLIEHRARHHELIQQVNDFVNRFNRGEIALSLPLMQFLREWLTTHIQKEDMAYSGWMNDHGVY